MREQIFSETVPSLYITHRRDEAPASCLSLGVLPILSTLRDDDYFRLNNVRIRFPETRINLRIPGPRAIDEVDVSLTCRFGT